MRSDFDGHIYISMTILLIVQIVFGLLKLTNQLDWSWWWVLSPFVLPMAILFGLGLVSLCIMLLIDQVSKLFGHKIDWEK